MNTNLGIFWLVGLILLCICFVLSMTIGAVNFSIFTVYQAFTAFDGSTEHLIIQTLRLPRSLICLFVGASLAVAGCLMQGITGNPLASPSILGINSGAALAVVSATLWGRNSLNIYAGFAFLGAAISAIAVYGFANLNGKGILPLNLILAGAAVTAFTSSVTTGILILNERSLDEIRFWLAGSVAGRDLDLFLKILPYLLLGLLIGLVLAKQITLLSLGEEIALGLGQNTVWIKLFVALAVVLLAGGSVAIAGPVGFLGLIVPHLGRLIVGTDYRLLLPAAILIGSILLLLADITSRLLISPQEIPVGLIMPVIGTPLFIYLIAKKLR